MSLFRDEGPALGAGTLLKEVSGFGAGNPVTNYFKPQTREYVTQFPLTATSATSGWLFVAPFKCQVLSAKVVYTTAGGAAAAVQVVNIPQAKQPLVPSTAADGTNAIAQLSSAIALTGAANTVFAGTLSAAAGSPNVINAGDMLAYQLSGTLTGLAGGYLQVEISQLG